MSKDSKGVKKIKLQRKRMSRRSRALFLAFVAGASVLVGSVVVTVAAHGEEYSRIVLSQQSSSNDTSSAKRGKITDRNGAVLAYSNKIYTLILDPWVVEHSSEEEKEATVKALKDYFDLESAEVLEKINSKPDSRYERMLKEIPAEKHDAFIKELEERQKDSEKTDFKGIWFEEGYLRSYPFNTLAADVIGFATEANGGETGLEKQYDDVLTGVNGLNLSYVGEGAESEKESKEASDGYNVVSTIDSGVQSILEKKLLEYNNEKRSANTAAIVYDPNNGEILGMASWPFFDLNDPRNTEATKNLSADEAKDKTDSEKLYQLWNNFCVSRSYEPGSTFKSITVASALEEGKTHDGDEYYCKGYKEVENYAMKCWMNSEGGHGTLDLEEALGDSCNVALMDIGFELGAERMVENQYAFGFGTRTGVDLPDESRGVLKEPQDMAESDIASNSFGQNLEVNMVQMVAAYGALLNGGNYYQPHIVKAITDSEDKTVKVVEPTVVRRPVTKETSEHIKQYLKAGVEEYAVMHSKVEGYSMGGKTATAEKHPRSEKKWLVSVMSFAPAEDPAFILYVLIDEPEGTTGGDGDGMDSQYLTKEIMTELLPYMGVSAAESSESSGITDEEEVQDDQSGDPEYEEEAYGDTETEYSEDENSGEEETAESGSESDSEQEVSDESGETAEDDGESGTDPSDETYQSDGNESYEGSGDEDVYYKEE